MQRLRQQIGEQQLHERFEIGVHVSFDHGVMKADLVGEFLLERFTHAIGPALFTVGIERLEVLLDVRLSGVHDQPTDVVDVQGFDTIVQTVQDHVEDDDQIFGKLLIGGHERIVPDADVTSDDRSNVRVAFLLNGEPMDVGIAVCDIRPSLADEQIVEMTGEQQRFLVPTRESLDEDQNENGAQRQQEDAPPVGVEKKEAERQR